MISVHPHSRTATRSAYELQRAAANLRRSVRDPDAVRVLPVTLAHVDEVLDELATTMLVLAQSVAETTGSPNTSLDHELLSPQARALRWHLHELAARLRAARSAGASSREWAEELLAAEREWGAPRTELQSPADSIAAR
jgi:hypothetical protein